MDEFLDDPELPELPKKAMRQVAVALARAFLAGDSSPPGLRERGGITLGQPWPWLVPLALRLHFDLGLQLQAAQHDAIVAAILDFPRFREAFATPGTRPAVRAHFPFHPTMGTPPRRSPDWICRRWPRPANWPTGWA